MSEYINKSQTVSRLKDFATQNAEFSFIKEYDELQTAIRIIENLPTENIDSQTTAQLPQKPVKDYVNVGSIDITVEDFHCPNCNYSNGCDLEDTNGERYNFCPCCGQPFDWDDVEGQTDKDLNWYMFSQNNSYGRYDINDKVCEELYIEAESFDEAVQKAEELGCYWDGVKKGIDCSCCGDRWDKRNDDPIDIESFKNQGMEVWIVDGEYPDTVSEWYREYGNYLILDIPKFVCDSDCPSIKVCKGKIRINNIEEYAQLIADKYSRTSPAARIYYRDGTVKEIFSSKDNNG